MTTGKLDVDRSEWWRDLAEFGRDVLRSKRINLGYTQQQMAGLIGVDQSRISRIERGLGKPHDRPAAEQWAKHYRLDAKERKGWFELLWGTTVYDPDAIPHEEDRFDVLTNTIEKTSSNDLAEWEKTKQIIQNWLVSNNRDLRSLAEETGIEASQLSEFFKRKTALTIDSIMKLYNIIFENTDPLDRRTFLKVMGVLPVATALNREPLLTTDLQSFDTKFAGHYELGTRLIVAGNDLDNLGLWEKAIYCFHEAESILGTASSQAARAAIRAVLMLVTLGDYNKAEEEIVRVKSTYGSVMDPETKADLYRMRGWLEYYQGSFPQAERWFGKCIRIAEQTGVEHIAESAQHFLGRTYRDWAQTYHQKRERDLLFHKAEMQFDKAYQIHLKWGTESQMAFDLFRKAQLLQVQYKGRDAQQLRDRVRQIFGGDLAVLHIEIEEAKLALEGGQIQAPRLKAEEVLNEWAQVKYAKGMADALRILGLVETMKRKPDKALKRYAAALSIYPFENHPSNSQLLGEIGYLYSDIVRSEGQKGYYKLIRHIQELAETRQGDFSYLHQVSADRTMDIARVLSRLGLGGL